MIVAVIQARMGSTRLPQKVLAPIGGKTMLERVIERTRRIPEVAWVVVATSTDPQDDHIVEVAKACCVGVYRGSLEDVLGRYEGAAHALHLKSGDHLVRITADCPALDPHVSSRVIQMHLTQQVDYTSNLRDWPDGLDTEVFTRRALQDAFHMASGDEDREHVTPWMRRNLFCAELPCESNLRHLKFSVDTEEDLEYVRELYAALGEDFSWGEILRVKPGSLCPECRRGVPHAQRSLHSIGGSRDYTVWDLHETNVSGGFGTTECLAWMIHQRSTLTTLTICSRSLGGEIPRSPDADQSSPQCS